MLLVLVLVLLLLLLLNGRRFLSRMRFANTEFDTPRCSSLSTSTWWLARALELGLKVSMAVILMTLERRRRPVVLHNTNN
jgi:hypothetical protein